MSLAFWTRRAYFSPPSVAPSQSVDIHTRTISSAIAEPMILPPMHRTLLSAREPGAERVLAHGGDHEVEDLVPAGVEQGFDLFLKGAAGVVARHRDAHL